MTCLVTLNNVILKYLVFLIYRLVLITNSLYLELQLQNLISQRSRSRHALRRQGYG